MVIRIKTAVRNLVAGIIMVGVILGIGLLIFSNKDEIDTNTYSTDVNRVSYINLQGWNVEETPYTEKVIKIPEKFNKTYDKYNDIQNKQGWDLSDYKGETATEYTYKVLNYNGGEENIYARLIILDNRIIGGDIFQMESNGFIKTLK
jgi:hypothetical protein